MTHAAFGPRNVLYQDGLYEVQFGGVGDTAHATVTSRYSADDKSDDLKGKILAKLAAGTQVSYTLVG